MATSKVKQRLILTAVGVPLAALYLALPGFLLYVAYEEARVITFGSLWGEDYEPVACRVLSANEVHVPNVQAMEIEFEYRVPGGGSLIGDKVGPNRDSSSWAWDLRPGDLAECYYSRDRPEDAFVMDGTRRGAWFAVLIGTPVALLLLVFPWIAFRRFG